MSQKRSWFSPYVLEVDDPFGGLSPEMLNLLRAELAEGEDILWFEQPNALSLCRENWSYNYFQISMSLMMGFFYIGLPLLTGRPENIQGFNLLIVGIWVFALALLPLRAARQARNSLFVLTNQRAMRLNVGVKGVGRVKSYYMHQQIHPATLKVKAGRNERGKLLFAKANESFAPKGIGFWGISRVKEVKQLFDEVLTLNAENSVAALPLRIQPAIKAELTTGERVLWAGQPDPYWWDKQEKTDANVLEGCMQLALLGVMIYSLLLVGIGILTGGLILWAGVIMFVVTSIVLAFFIRYSSRKKSGVEKSPYKTAYLLTTRRVMQVTAFTPKTERVTSYYYSGQPQKERLMVAKHKDNTGDIFLSVVEDGKVFRPKMQLIGVWEPDKVERLLRQLLANN